MNAVSHPSMLHDDLLRRVATTCPNLELLATSGYTCSATDKGIQAISKLRRLKHLRLWGSNKISEIGMTTLLCCISPSLTRLELDDMECVTDKVIGTLSQRLPNLTFLSVAGCRMVSAKSIIHVSQGPQKLSHLDLAGCGMVLNDNAVQALVDMPSIVVLTLHRNQYCLGRKAKLSLCLLSACISIAPDVISALELAGTAFGDNMDVPEWFEHAEDIHDDYESDTDTDDSEDGHSDVGADSCIYMRELNVDEHSAASSEAAATSSTSADQLSAI